MSSNDSNVIRVSSKNLVDTAGAMGNFHTLGKALEAAGFSSVLKGSGPYTVFAPTDEAFEKLPKDTLNNWLRPENKAELISVLKYHVLPGRVSAVDLEKLTTSKMMQGQTATITKEGDTFRIGEANITKTDITSSNGVIHAIDAVNVPTKQ
jgi:uncharacterized surface protein with fasciclin (FAS1) repeats